MESISSTDTQTQWDDISPSSYRFTIDTILWILDFMMPQRIESSLLLCSNTKSTGAYDNNKSFNSKNIFCYPTGISHLAAIIVYNYT